MKNRPKSIAPILEKQKKWAQKLTTTAQIANTNYQVLVHNMPLSFLPESSEHVKDLKNSDAAHIPGITIQRATWLKNHHLPGKKSGSLIIWFEHAEHPDKAISKGILWKYELKAQMR